MQPSTSLNSVYTGRETGRASLSKAISALVGKLGRTNHQMSSLAAKQSVPAAPSETPSLQPPAWLQSSTAEISKVFDDLHWEQQVRLSNGLRSASTPSQWARCSSEAVTERNRYSNIDPFASNRVKLKVPIGTDDYINASPIALRCSKTGVVKRWIATQGPTQFSNSHFWRMIWSETGPPTTPAVIVMLTQTHEAGREKCFPYYPLSFDDPVMYIDDSDFHDGFSGRVELQETQEDKKTRAQIRKLRFVVRQVDHDGAVIMAEKLVWHYLFSGWPDFGVPEDKADQAALVELIKESSTAARKGAEKSVEPAPRIIHCSAGVGRSGTFIALDYLLEELSDGALDEEPSFPKIRSAKATDGIPVGIEPPLSISILEPSSPGYQGTSSHSNLPPPTPASASTFESGGMDPIAATVDNLRKQRMMMVQGEEQFHFLYAALLRMWNERHNKSKDC